MPARTSWLPNLRRSVPALTGIVISDRSAGAVMPSLTHPHNSGLEIVKAYAVSVTNADVIMTDGKSLEHVGEVISHAISGSKQQDSPD